MKSSSLLFVAAASSFVAAAVYAFSSTTYLVATFTAVGAGLLAAGWVRRRKERGL